MSKLVFIQTIPRPTASGISDWVSDTSGVKLKKTKVGRAKDRLMALYSDKVGGLANYISYNYYNDPKTGQPVLNDAGKPMLLQEYLEKKWNKPPGFFTNQAVSRHYKGDGSDFTYFQQQVWSLADGSTVLDLDKMDDELGYYVMLASSKVANSEKEWREHKWPKATHYIALENESEELTYARTQMKSKAYAALHSPELNEAVKRKIVSLLGLTSTLSKWSEQQVHNALVQWIESSSYTAGSNIDRFQNFVTMLKTAPNREKFEAMYLLKNAEDLGIVRSKQDIWTWLNPKGSPVTMGNRYSEALDFILNPKKADEVLEIKQNIKERQNL
jgi:hypothetical protein